MGSSSEEILPVTEVAVGRRVSEQLGLGSHPFGVESFNLADRSLEVRRRRGWDH